MDAELKRLNGSNLEKLRNWRNSEHIKSVSISKEYITPEQHQKWFQAIGNDPFSLHWIITVDKVEIGYAAIKDVNLGKQDCCFANLYIGERDYLGLGIGAIAEYKIIDFVFENYAITKIRCSVLSNNTTVISLHKKFGFNVINHDTDLNEVSSLLLLKEDWLNRKDRLKSLLFKMN
jgi:UDP-4-amino-4,6-dideoxy-N-acetyl-beta-L-altrosamine N-acetyltransferase